MTAPPPRADQRIVAVTGGGGGIGAAIAEELGRQGAYVVTMDPLVSLDGREVLPSPEGTTAGRINAAGGTARATSASVTDRAAVVALFEELGRVDGVVNVAGITRPTSFARGSEVDWREVLAVHLDGYLNVLAAALPMMASVGGGRILGVTSGSGWRAADAGAYACAKRAVAALTWQLGPVAPDGVAVNAISPIAVTRMVTAALARAQGASSASTATGGLSLGSMPEPEALGPFGAHLVGDGAGWCRGRVLFTAGTEVALVQEPRLIEVVATDGATSLPHLLAGVTTGALGPAELQQASTGGGNPRFTSLYGAAPLGALAASAARSCAVVADASERTTAIAAALEARGVTCTTIEPTRGFEAAGERLRAAGDPDAVVVVSSGAGTLTGAADGWRRVLDDHRGLADGILADAGWARAVADAAGAAGHPVRLVTLTDAVTSGGRSRAQASAQLARAARGATGEQVSAFAVAVEAGARGDDVAALTAHLVADPEATGLAGAELAVGAGWVGLRSHPRPAGSITLGAPEVPTWLDDALRSVAGVAP